MTLLPDKINNLKATSLIRLSFLAVLAPLQINRVMGKIENTTHQILLERLSEYIKA